MKTSQPGHEKLKILGNHLSNGKLFVPWLPPKQIKNGYTVPIFHVGEHQVQFLFYPIVECVYLFPLDWGMDKQGIPKLIRHPQLNVVDALLEFFEIDPSGFLKLFAVDLQTPLEVKGPIREDIHPKDLGAIILKWIKETKTIN
jgi:hypothetical protein